MRSTPYPITSPPTRMPKFASMNSISSSTAKVKLPPRRNAIDGFPNPKKPKIALNSTSQKPRPNSTQLAASDSTLNSTPTASTSNQFASLTDNDNMDTAPAPVSRLPTKRDATSNAKPRPIFVEHNPQVTRNTIATANLTHLTAQTILGSRKVQVTCGSAEDKKLLIAHLKLKQIPHTTFTEKSDKPAVFVLKRHYHQSCEDMLATLLQAGVAASKVTFLSDSQENPIFLVHFPAGAMSLNTLVHNHRNLDCIIVKWELMSTDNKRLTQCRNCQLYGHAATNCGRPYRCIKCIETHMPGECARKTREGTAKCINCHSKQLAREARTTSSMEQEGNEATPQPPLDCNHAANSTVCPSFKAYKAFTDSKKKRKFPQPLFIPTNTNQQTPWKQPSRQPQQNDEWPSLVQHHQKGAGRRAMNLQHVSDTVEELEYVPKFTPHSRASRHTANFSNFAETQRKFASLPGIDEALILFSELTDQLAKVAGDPIQMAIVMMGFSQRKPTLNAC